ncbi:MAG: N-acetyl sugar amidotransferase [Planctomycetota bacterium]
MSNPINLGLSTPRYCSRCVYPAHAVNAMLDDDGVCNACRNSEEFALHADASFWAERKSSFERLIEETHARNKDGVSWDCIIPVSGGKDSYWQAHLVKKVYGLRPLLVTYHGNNYLPEGQANLDLMRDRLGCDHMVFGPSVDTLRRLNLAAFRVMGDMNWHSHAGIKIVPVRLAVQLGIPLLVWGEITWTVSGMFAPDDFAEYNKRTVFEHDLRGFTREDFAKPEVGLEPGDLTWMRFPSDSELDRVGVRGIYIGNFFPWKPNEHTALMQELYGFETSREPFERTYRRMSNLDDMHENGAHDYMKFIKFGYGRASDHASKDIRDGLMTREEGVETVRRYDHVKPMRDISRWLEYVGITEDEFDQTADTFRDPRVWWIEEGKWWKHNLWGGASSYGEVRLPDRSMWDRYTTQAAHREPAGAGDTA